MKITFILLTIILTAMTTFSQTQIPPVEAGVSQTLAKWRGANYSDVRYKLNITLEKGAPLITGDIEIRVKLTDEGARNDLILDWRTTQFRNDRDKPNISVDQVNDTQMGKSSNDNGKELYWVENEHLIIEKRFLRKGENTVQISFASPIKTSGAAITRYVDKEDGAEYVYSLFVPSDASTAFPVFDQPDLKARFHLETTAPKSWNVISNSEAIITVEQAHPTLVFYSFEETKPISTYVFAFAAGEFSEFVEGENEPIQNRHIKDGDYSILHRGIDLKSALITGKPPKKAIKTPYEPAKIYVRKSQAEKFKQHAAEVFRLNREGVKFLESYFDYKFPFPKYDLVLIPEFPFGGMEHAGATFLREDRVIFPTEPTKNDYITRANVIFHEAAHQWFGDTVTMKWFDDLWLKEGFAEFMAYKTLEKVMPEYNAWKIFYERNKQAAYLTDSTKGTTPIYQEIPNLSAAKSAYGNIVYRKAPSFLRQAEFYLGEDKFQTAVRAFLKKHEFANAEWTDFVKELKNATDYEKNTRRDLNVWATNWVRQRSLAKVRVKFLRSFSDRKPFCLAEQENILKEKGWWESRFQTLLIQKNGKRETLNCFTMQTNLDDFNKESSAVALQMEKYQYEAAIPNYQDYGYGIFVLDKKSRAYVLANIQTEKDDFLRTTMWGALWDSVRETELNPKDYVELVIKNINVESDESTIQTLLGRVSTAMNYYLSDAQSKALAPRIENALLNGMAKAETVGQKITFYRAYLNIASTDKAKKLLKDILENNGKMSIAVDVGSESGAIRLTDVALPLKTKDKFDIVTKLLILGDVSAPNMLAELEKTETSDEAKRYAYAAKAGIGTAENKAKFWNDFTNNKEISESYIESAFVAFNSSKHADLTLIYLEKSLAELPNLKRNRKIFFVNGWLAAFIGGQKSVEALAIVNKFLADNPNLDRDLRLKVLENVDGLERAVKIRAKYEK